MIFRAMHALPLLLSLALCGCVTGLQMFAVEPEDNEAILARGLVCAIPLKSATSVSVAQSLTISFGDKSMSFDVQIQITPEMVDLVALDKLGRRAITIQWRDGHISSSTAPWFPALVRPADILADVAIVYFPAESIAPALSACGAKLESRPFGRTVAYNNVDLIDVAYDQGLGWERSARLTNMSLGFRIDIKSVQLGQ